MLVQKHVSEMEVIQDFATNINDFSEQYHLKTKLPRTMVCQKMIEMFHGKVKHSDDWMRKKIDVKYKVANRVSNGKLRGLSKIDRLRLAFKKAESDLLEATHEATITAGKDF